MLVDNNNDHQFYDYKKPIAEGENDFRTSYYRGMNKFLPKEPCFVRKPPTPSCNTTCAQFNNSELRYDYRSEKQHEYTLKTPIDHSPVAERAMKCTRPTYIDDFYRRLLKNPVKPIHPFHTTYKLDYDHKIPLKEETIAWNPSCPVQVTKPKEILSANTKGYSKFMDIYMTTNMKDFVPYTERQQHGIAAKNNITLWDWLETPKSNRGYGLKEHPMTMRRTVEPMYDKIRFKCPIRDRIVPENRFKVPVSLMQTEMQREYCGQDPINFELDCPVPVVIPGTGLKSGTEKSEYSMYGSGMKTHAIIDARGELGED